MNAGTTATATVGKPIPFATVWLGVVDYTLPMAVADPLVTGAGLSTGSGPPA